VLDYCRVIISENKNDSKTYLAKRVLINYYTSPDYNYTDCVVELNKKENFSDLVGFDVDTKTDQYYDYDIVFIHGLNVYFHITQ
jgi:hypothetical protein